MTDDAFRYKTFFDLSVDLLCIANMDGYFEELNPGWTEVLGWSVEELCSKPFLEFVHPDDIPATLAEVEKLAQGQKTISFLNRYRTAAGGWRWLEWTSGPDPTTGKLYAAARDVTRTRALQDALVLAREEAEQANRTKSQFLANMSHELRTPLNAILGYSEMMQEDARVDGHDQYVGDLDRVIGAGRHLLALINEVLDLAKVEAGRVELLFEDLDLGALVASVADTVGPLITANENSIVLEGVRELGTVHTDEVRLRQVITNALSNAAKFTKAGTIRVIGEAFDQRGTPMVRLTVEDSGIGMTPDQLERVFEPFVQGDASTTRKYGGTGLGMAISQKFMTLLGGSISVRSELGRGTQVVVELPVRPASAARALGDEAGTTTSSISPVLDASRPLVLVADDDNGSRALLRRVLERGGYRVVTARDGNHAVELAQEHKPDLVTLDIMMPGLDGWGALQQIRASEHMETVPVLMCSVLDERRLAVAVGADGYLQKPVDRHRLLELARRHLGDPGGHVLVVDDDPDARLIMGRRLGDAGHEVSYAANGVEALARLRNRDTRPDLVLLDLMMPEMDGFEVLEHLSTEDGTLSRLPVVVVTAKELDSDDFARFTRQVQDVLSKSVGGTHTLLEAVDRALGTARAAEGSDQ